MRLRLLLIALVGALFGLAPTATAVDGAIFTYDAAAIQSVGTHELSVAGPSNAQLTDSVVQSASSLAEALDTSTTPIDQRNATNTAADLADDVVRPRAERINRPLRQRQR